MRVVRGWRPASPKTLHRAWWASIAQAFRAGAAEGRTAPGRTGRGR